MNTGEIGSTIKTYLVVILSITVAILLLTRSGCGTDDTKITSYYKPDSVVYVPGTIDTVKLVDKQIVYKPFKLKSDTVYITKGIDSSISKETNIYDDSVHARDVVTHYRIKTIGRLSSLELSSRLTNRYELKRVDTLKITKFEEVVKDPKFSLYGGISLSGNKTSFDVGPKIGMIIKNKHIELGYNIIQQQLVIGTSIKLWQSKH